VTITVDNAAPEAFATAPTAATTFGEERVGQSAASGYAAVTGTEVTLHGASYDAAEPDTAPAASTGAPGGGSTGGTSSTRAAATAATRTGATMGAAPDPTVGRRYRWSQTDGPITSLVAGTGDRFRLSSFTPTSPGTYTFQLVVTDHGGAGASSTPATVSVVVRRAAAAGTLSGVVRGPGGTTLGGATVEVFDGSPFGRPVASTTSAAGGAWSVPHLRAGDSYYIRFTKSGYATRWSGDELLLLTARAVHAPDALADITLTPTAGLRTITGVARTSTGAGVAGLVLLFDEHGFVIATRAGADGSYTFTGLTPDNAYRVQVYPTDPDLAPRPSAVTQAGARSGSVG